MKGFEKQSQIMAFNADFQKNLKPIVFELIKRINRYKDKRDRAVLWGMTINHLTDFCNISAENKERVCKVLLKE